MYVCYPPQNPDDELVYTEYSSIVKLFQKLNAFVKNSRRLALMSRVMLLQQTCVFTDDAS